mgnify:CR=1 FL=1
MRQSRSRRSFAPIPGTEAPARGLFIDRWGTLLEMPSNGVFERFDKVRFVPGAIDALFRTCQAGWRVYLIGNEDGVARGTVRDEAWFEFEHALLEHLRGFGVSIARNYACLEDPHGGSGAHRKCSVFRLPDTGIFFHAQQCDGVQLRKSFVIGDSSLEIAAGTRSGLRTIGVRTGDACRDGALKVEPEVEVASLTEALELFQHSESFARP